MLPRCAPGAFGSAHACAEVHEATTGTVARHADIAAGSHHLGLLRLPARTGCCCHEGHGNSPHSAACRGRNPHSACMRSASQLAPELAYHSGSVGLGRRRLLQAVGWVPRMPVLPVCLVHFAAQPRKHARGENLQSSLVGERCCACMLVLTVLLGLTPLCMIHW
jgi:hypothetical protein